MKKPTLSVRKSLSPHGARHRPDVEEYQTHICETACERLSSGYWRDLRGPSTSFALKGKTAIKRSVVCLGLRRVLARFGWKV
jgi:hypothetical protein